MAVRTELVKEILWKMANRDPAYPVEDSIPISSARVLARKYAKEKVKGTHAQYTTVSSMQ